MSFKSILSDIGTGLKKFFENPVVQGVEKVAIPIAEDLFPAITPLVNGVIAAVGKAEALAASAGQQSGSGAQKLALAISDSEEIFNTFEAARGVTIDPAGRESIINSIVAILNAIPAPTQPVS